MDRPQTRNAWEQEYTNYRSLEDQEPSYYPLPKGPHTPMGDIRVAVSKAAVDYYFKNSRDIPEHLLKSSSAGRASELLEDAITYSEQGSRYALIFCDDEVQLFTVTSDGYSPGLYGYYGTLGPAKVKNVQLYQVFIVEDGYGMLERVVTPY